MAISEATITNLKKQLEFYKQLSEQLQQEHQQLKEQLQQRDEVIDEAIKRCDLEISASSYQYEKNHRQQELVYKVAHERIRNILTKYKGDSNE